MAGFETKGGGGGGGGEGLLAIQGNKAVQLAVLW